MIWLALAVLLIAQNLSFTLVSRARNSGSILWNGVASIFSNGIWIAGQATIIGIIFEALRSGDITKVVLLGAFYTTFTVIGSMVGQYIALNFIEKGNRRVGARGQKKPIVRAR
jgi:hypothetical protein